MNDTSATRNSGDNSGPNSNPMGDGPRPSQTAVALLPRAAESERPRMAGPDVEGQSRRSFALVHPDPTFVAQLIATAAQMPQTRTLRRASPEDAQSSYREVANHNRQRAASRPIGTSRVV